jgi:hypothetical protein
MQPSLAAREPAKPGSAKASLSDALRKKFGGEDAPAARPGNEPSSKAAPSPQPPEAAPDPETAPPSKSGAAPSTEDQPPTGTEGPKTGKTKLDWKLLDQFKARALKAETEALELRKQIIPEDQRKAASSEVESLRKQNAEMQEELRYVNAKKYDPEIQKAQSEYEASFRRAMYEFRDLTVSDPNNPVAPARRFTPDDMLELVNLDLRPAREVAEKVFGSFANDVMAHRKTIRDLFDAQESKLVELKKTGATRDQQRLAQRQEQMGKVSSFVKTTYESAVKEALENPQIGTWLKPKDGDTAWNEALDKATKFVEGAYQQNALDPRHTPEQRAEIVRQHAAIRNRAIGYTPLFREFKRVTKELEATAKELAAFKKTTPSTGGREAPSQEQPAHGMDALRQAMAKIVRPL